MKTGKLRLLFCFLIVLLVLTACSGEADVTEKQLSVVLGGETLEGTYTGHINHGTPEGAGTFTFDDGSRSIRYEGSFQQGTATGDGELEISHHTLTFQDKEYTGTFSGKALGGVPEGEGSFTFEEGTSHLRYEGEFHDGLPTWSGTIDASEFTLAFPDGKVRPGSYLGGMLAGLPEGQGRFSTQNDSGNKYSYDGEWKNGAWNGQGTWQFYDTDDTMVRRGHFENCVFTPTYPELIDSLSTWPLVPFTLKPESLKFIEEHPDLFPAANVADMTAHLESPLVKVTGQVFEIFDYS